MLRRRQILVKGVPGLKAVPSGTVTSVTNCAASHGGGTGVGGRRVGGMGVGGIGVGGIKVEVGGGVALGGRLALGVRAVQVTLGGMAVGPAGLGRPPLAICVSCATAVSPAESLAWDSRAPDDSTVTDFVHARPALDPSVPGRLRRFVRPLTLRVWNPLAGLDEAVQQRWLSIRGMEGQNSILPTR